MCKLWGYEHTARSSAPRRRPTAHLGLEGLAALGLFDDARIAIRAAAAAAGVA